MNKLELENQKLRLFLKHLLATLPVNKKTYATQIPEPLNTLLDEQISNYLKRNINE